MKYIKSLYLLYNTAVCLGRMSAHLHTSIPRSRIWLIYTYNRLLTILHIKRHVSHIIFFTFKDTHYRNALWFRQYVLFVKITDAKFPISHSLHLYFRNSTMYKHIGANIRTQCQIQHSHHDKLDLSSILSNWLTLWVNKVPPHGLELLILSLLNSWLRGEIIKWWIKTGTRWSLLRYPYRRQYH